MEPVFTAMKKINLIINRQKISLKEGTTILEAASGAGISIPTLCRHPLLKPSEVCGICVVEAALPPVP